ncbi:hydrogenase expression/formation protein HypE [Anaerotignum sp.]|uniref:hydrogenase expression/formation protein HypE n=1 Tax=Anaerotignum sp. TaxID=2039241 RepID=UPI0027147AA3|nr:hydrogenase expression/formation protein HypE [Anaerotignum sp.]
MTNKIRLYHGDGGVKTGELINQVFLKYYGNDTEVPLSDSFVFDPKSSRLAYTTDSFVVQPLFFRGGDIGKLAICGTLNDLATAGAKPFYLSAGFIIEEGFDIDDLCRIAQSMGEVCKANGVKIVTGDTKVVEKGCADGLFINTSGIGVVSDNYALSEIKPGDEIIITGTIAEHGTAILLDRYDLAIETNITSDCCALSHLIIDLNEDLPYIKLMKDPTRGGIATVLNEIAAHVGYNVELIENTIPINPQVIAVNQVLGIDPLYLACEGRMILVVKEGFGYKILQDLKKHYGYKDAQMIGHFTKSCRKIVYLQTDIGGKRVLPSLEGQTVPRIC